MIRVPRRLLDLALVLAGAAILLILLLAPPVSTPLLPEDEVHQPLLHAARQQGKKSAEASCQNCHNSAQVPFTADHPDGRRCLFCHRLPDSLLRQHK